MFCNNCGSQVNRDEKYCGACGEENPHYVAPKGRRRASGNGMGAPLTAAEEKKLKTKATVGLILGVVSLLTGGLIGIVLAVVALRLTGAAKMAGDFKAAGVGSVIAVIGLILSVISLVIHLIVLIIVVILVIKPFLPI